MHLIISPFTDPFKNLAVENYFLDNLEMGESILLLWINDPCVVMGRFQNPWIECNLDLMKKQNITLVRRQSGGGCVYHDQGNVNFSFINWNKNHDKEKNQKFWMNFFLSLNIDVRTNQRGDFVVFKNGELKKISGSAFKQKKDKSFHHGTLLFNTEIDQLNSYLLAGTREREFDSKSIASVRSNVTNIGDLVSIEHFFEAIEKYEEILSVTTINQSLLKKKTLIDYENKIKNPAWLWGETPLFTKYIKSDKFDLDLGVKKALITQFSLRSELLHDSLLKDMNDKFLGIAFNYQSLLNAFVNLEANEIYKDEFIQILEEINNDLNLKFNG